MVQEMGLIIAIKRHFMPDANLSALKKEWDLLSDKDKAEFVDLFNKHKVLGDDVVIVLKK